MAENQRDHLIKIETEKGKRMEEVRLGTIGSGVVTLRYPDFVSTCVGAKDTWGENYVQIEGE